MRFVSRLLAMFVSLVLLSGPLLAEAPPVSQIVPVLEKLGNDYLAEINENQKASTSKSEALRRQITVANYYYASDYYSTLYSIERAIKDSPDDLQLWLILADTAGQKDFAQDKDKLSQVKAAYGNALKLAKDPMDRAAVLLMMSRFDGDYQPLYAEAVAKLDKSKVEEHATQMLADYPKVFGLYNVEIPEKSDVGSVCLTFSKPLIRLKSFAYEDYIAITPAVKDVSVVAKGNRLCISGLAFGSSYKVTMKKGLAAEGSYKLAEDQTIEVIVKHRKPSITFRERGYILPSKGPQLLPLKAVNVASVQLKVYQVPLRNLPQILNQGDFQNQLYPWKLDQLKNEQGEMIAEGTFDCKGAIDETAVRGIPLDKILGSKLEPGIYIVQAMAGDKSSYSENDNATQWVVVSDIGMSTSWGPDGLHVNVRSLASAQALEGVEVGVIARNGRQLGTLKSDKSGYVQFDQKMLEGKDSNQPLFIHAMLNGQDFTFLSLKKEGFDFSDRGVKGRDPAQKADAYVYTERGIYRPGDEVSIVALLRDQDGKAMKDVPLTYKIVRPDGVEAFTQVERDHGAGSYVHKLDTQASNFTGTWTASVYLDPKGPAIGTATFKIQDFVPPRIEVKGSIKQKVLHAIETLDTDLVVRYFYGPRASNLKAEGLVELVVANKPFEQWQDYQFGLEEEAWTPIKFKSEATTTNDQGEAVLKTAINVKPDTTKLLTARSVATVFEAGGRGRTISEQTLFWHQPYVIGIAGQFKDKSAASDSEAKFHVVALDESGKQLAVAGLNYTLYEETYGFTWFREGNAWNYEKNIDSKPIATGKFDLAADAPKDFGVPVSYGYYRLEVLDPKTGVASSYRFHAGWGGQSEEPDRPDMVEMTLDKASYKPGEKAVVSLVAPFDGALEIVAVDDKSLHRLHVGQATRKGTRIEIPLTAELLRKSGVYLMATVYRPGDVKSEKIAGRAIGLIWLDAKAAMPKIDVTLKAPNIIRPEQEFQTKVCLSKPLKNPRATVMVVDEAILQLTEFKTPNPFDYFYDQTKLAFAVRDSYGQLINPFGARPGDFKVGGDGLSQKALTKLAARTFKTVSFFSGIISDFQAGTEEGCAQQATVSFKLPEFSGQVRVMSVVWDEEATGSTQADLTVRDDLETYIALPRFLAPGDETSLIVDAQNLTDKEGTFSLTLAVEGEVELPQEFKQTITLKKDEMVHLPVTIRAKNVGVGKLTLKIQGEGINLEKHWEIAVRSSVYEQSLSKAGVLNSGESIKLDQSLRAELKPGTGSNILTIGSIPTFGAERFRKQMRAYPYSCLEQLTSRLSAEVYTPADKRDAAKVEDILGQMVSLQQFDGPFALWSADGSAEPWLSIYALDLLSKAQTEKMDVSAVMLSRGMDWLKERARRDDDSAMSLKAYSLYLLARQGQGSLGAVKYFADNSQKNLSNRDDLAFIAAAFALYGDAESAKLWFDKAIAVKEDPKAKRNYYESWISDTAILVALLAETTQNHPQLTDMAAQLADMVAKKQYLSTYEKGWLIRASAATSALAKPFKVTVGEQYLADTKPTSVNLSAEQLAAGVFLRNDGSTPMVYNLSLEGEPVDPAKLKNNGFTITRGVFSLDGQPIDLSQVKSGDLMVVVLKGELLDKDVHQVVVLDLLPSGFEIEKVKFDESYLQSNFDWLGDLTQLARVERRDDRYMAAFAMPKEGKFAMTYFVRALNPGSYKFPAASVESMYRPDLFARTAEGRLIVKP